MSSDPAVLDATRTELPTPGQMVRVRARSFLVEEVVPAAAGEQTLVRLSCPVSYTHLTLPTSDLV